MISLNPTAQNGWNYDLCISWMPFASFNVHIFLFFQMEKGNFTQVFSKNWQTLDKKAGFINLQVTMASRQAQTQWTHRILPGNAQSQAVFWPVQVVLARWDRCWGWHNVVPWLHLHCSSGAAPLAWHSGRRHPPICFSRTTLTTHPAVETRGFRPGWKCSINLASHRNEHTAHRENLGFGQSEAHPSFQASPHACRHSPSVWHNRENKLK